MKIDPSEPGGANEPTLDRYVRASRGSDASDEALRRISANLATAGVFARKPASPATSWRLYSKIGVGLAVLAGGWGSWSVLHTSPVSQSSPISQDSPTAQASRVSPALEATGTQAVADTTTPVDPKRNPASESVAAITNTDLPKAAISVDALPSVARPPARAVAPLAVPPAITPPPIVASAAAKAPERTADDAPTPPPRELELVQRAQAKLASDPEAALAITREQARLYPAGEYIQEREVFAVEALARLGRREEAQRRADALLRQFPRTPYVSRLEIALGGRTTVP